MVRRVGADAIGHLSAEFSEDAAAAERAVRGHVERGQARRQRASNTTSSPRQSSRTRSADWAVFAS